MTNIRKLSELIDWVDTRNKGVISTNLLGINIEKFFMPSVANIIGTDLSSYKLISKNQFACNPMHVGRDEKMPIALYMEEEPSIVSPAYFVFQVKDLTVLNPEFLMLWFRRAEFDRECWFYTDGSVRGGITWDEILDMSVPVPSIEEQNKIVSSYNDIEKRIKLKKQINDNLAEQLATSLAKLFNDNKVSYDNLPNGWAVATLGTYCDVKSGYAFKSDWWQEDGVKVIKIANIKDLTIDFNDCSYVSSENAEKATQFSVSAGDILIAMTGATTGKFGVVPYIDFVPRVNQRVGKFFLGSNPLNKAPFLFATLLQKEVTKKLQPDGETGSAQDNLSPDDIKNIPIIYPTTDIIDTFNKKHSVILREMMINFAEMNTLNNTLTVFLQTLSSI